MKATGPGLSDETAYLLNAAVEAHPALWQIKDSLDRDPGEAQRIVEAFLPAEQAACLRQIFLLQRGLLQQTAFLSSEQGIFPADEVSFHPRFGWWLRHDQDKAYLGKVRQITSGRITIGRRSYFSGAVELLGTAPFEIGSFTAVGSGFCVWLDDMDHRHDVMAQTEWSIERRMIADGLMDGTGQPLPAQREARVTIGHDVWIGRNVTLRNGITIGNGAAVGAHSLVTRDLEPYGVYAGTPAKLIRHRFPPAVAEQLMQLRWWDWPLTRIQEAATELNGPAAPFLVRDP